MSQHWKFGNRHIYSMLILPDESPIFAMQNIEKDNHWHVGQNLSYVMLRYQVKV